MILGDVMSVRYEVTIEAPSPHVYAPEYVSDGQGRAGLWLAAVLTGASGHSYFAMRGFDDLRSGGTQAYTFHVLDDPARPHRELFSELALQRFEDYQTDVGTDNCRLRSRSAQFSARGAAFEWRDAEGRFDLYGQRLGSTCIYQLPRQEGVEIPFRLVSQMARVEGTVDGDAVVGVMPIDQTFAPSGMTYFQLPLTRSLERQCSVWLAEYADGTTDAGVVWEGKGDTGFAPAHLVLAGTSTAHQRASTDTSLDDTQRVTAVRLQINDVAVQLGQKLHADPPTHSFGEVAAITGRPAPVRSFTLVERLPEIPADILAQLLDGFVQQQLIERSRVDA